MPETDETTKNLVPIGVVERLTGIPSDTIRVWERRYGAVVPSRTGRNARRYRPEHVRRLSLLRELSERGHAIGELARLETSTLNTMRDAAPQSSTRAVDEYDVLISDYLELITKLRVSEAHHSLTRMAAILPPITFIVDVISPLLRRVGSLWTSGEFLVAHEHIITGQLRHVLGAMSSQVEPPRGAPRIVVATPPGHLHEFGALIGSFLAANRGLQPIYLGTNTPWDELLLIAKDCAARAVLLSISRSLSKPELAETHDHLTRLNQATTVWLGLPETHELAHAQLPAQTFHRFEDLDAAVTRLMLKQRAREPQGR